MLSAINTQPSKAADVKNQIKITEKTPLLDKNGKLVKPGYCFTNMYDYDRGAIKANPLRIKEWDFYQISNRKYVMQITVADISFAAFANATLFDIETGERYESNMQLQPLSLGRTNLSKDAMIPEKLSRHSRGFDLNINVTEKQRKIRLNAKCKNEPFDVDISMDLFDNHESLIMAVPFDKDDKQFYLNHKMNCMPVSGTVKVGGLSVQFDPSDTFCVLDWGRGVWPFMCKWYWGNGSTKLPNGDIFGFEIGWGFGNMSAASENTLFYNGKAHKIGEIYCENSEPDWLKPWKFTSSDGRFEMTMTPVYDNYTKLRVLGIGNVCHQVFGRWNGTVTLDDGTVLEISDMTAFCEKSDNRW